MKLPISKRLLACCDFIPQGARVADVGTDHGYLAIHLLQTGIARWVYASDLRQGPLDRARENCAAYHVEEHVRFFLTEGVRDLPRDFDTLVCAGMGGDTIISILQQAPWLKTNAVSLVLQPQSGGNDLRRFLSQNGWQIQRETLCKDGRFLYTVLQARWGNPEPLSPGEEYLSPALRSSGSPHLMAYCDSCIRSLEQTLAGLELAKTPVPQEQREYFRRALAELNTWRDGQ